jgi:hypothetical protein
MSIANFWVVMPCDLVGDYKRFGRTYSLHFQGEVKMAAFLSSETLITTYKTSRHHNPEDHDQSFIYMLCADHSVPTGYKDLKN